MSLVHNERMKLMATALNNIAVATVVTGLIAPVVASMYATPTTTQQRWWWAIAGAWLLGGVGLHLIAQAILGRLKP